MIRRVIGMGNALTDVLINLRSDEILHQLELPRGSMNLVDQPFQEQVLVRTETLSRTPSLGGSASNTIRAMAKLGAEVGYIGKVGRDETGDFFQSELNRLGIDPHLFRGESPSGRCISLVSTDGERTMCTYLGAALEMNHAELSPAIFNGYDCLYIEGYLVQDHNLIRNAVILAKSLGMKVALDLASFNVVEENLDFLRELVEKYIDILFGNEQEIYAYTGIKNYLEAADMLGRHCSIVVIKVGMLGAYIKQRGKVMHVGVMASARRVDTTGAGDFYAAGFLAGLCRGLEVTRCGTIGAIAAGKVIEVVGTTFADSIWDEINALAAKVEADELIY